MHSSQHARVAVTEIDSDRSGGDVDVAPASRVQECRRDVQPVLGLLPRQPELELPLAHVLVIAVAREHVAHAGAARRSLEAGIGRDDVVGENGTVAPTANAQTLWVRDSDA